MAYIPEPIGSIKLWHSNTIPYGWQICDGSNGTPDMRGKVPVGMASADADFGSLGQSGGEKSHLLTVQELPSHRHSNGNGTVGTSPTSSHYTGGIDYTGYTGGDQPHNNLFVTKDTGEYYVYNDGVYVNDGKNPVLLRNKIRTAYKELFKIKNLDKIKEDKYEEVRRE